MMAEKPVLFSTPMVQAILDGRKTQTRRVIKPKCNKDYDRFSRMGIFSNIKDFDPGWHGVDFDGGIFVNDPIEQPRYLPGDTLWVRETWMKTDCFGLQNGYVYKADGAKNDILQYTGQEIKWKPSIFMPREAARIFLRVTDVRVERVQEISEDDAIAEGVPCDWPMEPIYCPACNGEGLTGAFHPGTLGYMEIDCPHCEKAVARYKNLWDSLNAKRGYGWDTNPWVWIYRFECI